ncbi:MAG TPA: hypothetical protein VKV28_03825 [Candidatus Binataceae bacterium]|nr:hypothetical protein [Candidatus Binataceae bacterium]
MARKRGRKRRFDEMANARAAEVLAKLMTPEIVLPVQLKSEPEDSPEFGLLRTLLVGAVSEFIDSFKPSRSPDQAERRRLNRAVAESWFAGDPGAPIEFETCCALFGMSGDEVRREIARLRERLVVQEAAAHAIAPTAKSRSTVHEIKRRDKPQADEGSEVMGAELAPPFWIPAAEVESGVTEFLSTIGE